MALWTPYADDTALDLSTSRRTPACTDTDTDEFLYGYVLPRPAPAQTQTMLPRYVPAGEHSPLSGDSVYSYSPRAGFISPPASPPGGVGCAPDADSLSDDPDYRAFERDALRAMAERNGGTLLGNNPRMRRAVQTSQAADDTYRKQRERNNYAAKQSRDRRKLREIHLALKVTYLRNELAKMKSRLASGSCARCHRACPY